MDILGIVLCSCCGRVDRVIVPARDKCTNYLGLENQKTPEGREERCHLSHGNWTYATTDIHEIPPSSIQGDLLAKTSWLISDVAGQSNCLPDVSVSQPLLASLSLASCLSCTVSSICFTRRISPFCVMLRH